MNTNIERSNNYKKFFTIGIINLFTFLIVNLIFNIKYEQVDDFIMYSLYSGLDGTYNFHAIYMHPIICIIIGAFYRLLPMINWHTIFLLSMQFICFTLIGYTILKKHYTGTSIILYTLFASIFYTTLLLLIQYTSVAALLIITAFFLLIDILEASKEGKNSKLKIYGIFTLFTLGIMTRIQSLLIVAPFYAIYLLIYLVRYKKKIIDKQKIAKLIKYYLITLLITLIVYISNFFIYNTNPIYKEYNEWNKLRTTIQDIIHIDYEKDKDIYDEVGWTKNDVYLFNTFGFGDENIFSKENLQKIVDTKAEKGNYYSLNTNLFSVLYNIYSMLINNCIFIMIIFLVVYILNLLRRNKMKENTLIFVTVILINAIFTVLGRNMLRVVIPEYILGTVLLIYNLNLKKEEKINDGTLNCLIIALIIVVTTIISGQMYGYNYKLENYESYRQIINYTNSNKENVYLYTIPSLQNRYLSYSAYKMPPKEAFSNLRQIGGWDMFTQNYYDFKERNKLEGNLLDLLKENVYLIDGEVIWSGVRYNNYKGNIALAIKEHYNIDVEFEEVESFNNLKIYKVVQVSEQ